MNVDAKTYVLRAIACVAVLMVCLGGSAAWGQQPAPAAPAAAAPQDEAALIGVLTGAGDFFQKQDACRKLRQIGTAKSVPALAGLLSNPELSNLARYAIEPMACAEAGQALRDAVAKTDGALKAGVVTSLGVRRDGAAVALIVPLMGDANADLAKAAAGALGRIATAEAVTALWDARAKAPAPLQPAIADGLLAAQQQMQKGGDSAGAAAICQRLLAESEPAYVRAGAFRGLIAAQPAEAPKRLLAALGGTDPVFCGLAAELVAETQGADTTAQYAGALASLPPAGQAALLRGLATRGDAAAYPAVLAAVNSQDVTVQVAAIKAMEKMGGKAEDVNVLMALLIAPQPEVVKAVRASITGMKSDAVDGLLATAVATAAPALKAELLGLLTERRAAQAVPLAVESLGNPDRAVRVAAFDSLARVGGNEQAEAVVKALAAATDDSERATAENSLGAICQRVREEALPVVLGAMNGAKIETRVALLRIAAGIGGPKALEAVAGAMEAPDKPFADEALRMVANWPTLEAAPVLMKLAQSQDASRQVLGLRGYVRLAREEQNIEARARMLTEAMPLAKQADDKKLILSAWGTVPTEQALGVLKPNLDDTAVQNEAGLAIVFVATELGKNADKKAMAVEAVKAVLDKCKDPGVRENAQKALDALK